MRVRALGVMAGAVCVWLVIAGCATAVQYATREHQPLRYVGDVHFGKPVIAKRAVVIPVSFTGGDWYKNSAIVPYKIDGKVKGAEIELHVVTSVATKDGGAAQQMALSGRPTGTYTIFYLDPDGARHNLGELTIPK